jgi:hypothetical protein
VPRFVILEHDHPMPHFDLMLEVGPVLRTWRLAAPPEAGVSPSAHPLPDHRPLYLAYEGPVSGGRGVVRRWDGGTYDGLVEGASRTRFYLRGDKVRGWCSVEGDGDGRWLLWFTPEPDPG